MRVAAIFHTEALCPTIESRHHDGCGRAAWFSMHLYRTAVFYSRVVLAVGLRCAAAAFVSFVSFVHTAFAHFVTCIFIRKHFIHVADATSAQNGQNDDFFS
jgi:hypothetical protein